MSDFRFRWRRRPNWGFEAYDAFEGEFRVCQVLFDNGGKLHDPEPYRWQVSAFYMPPGETCPYGTAATPREAALAAEAAFEEQLPRAHGFFMRTERAIDLAHRLGIELPPHTRSQAQREGLITSTDE